MGEEEHRGGACQTVVRDDMWHDMRDLNCEEKCILRFKVSPWTAPRTNAPLRASLRSE